MMAMSDRLARLRWPHVLAIYAAITLAYCWPLLPVLGSAFPNDSGDPGFITWCLWWNAHAVPLTERWWNAPIFVPMAGAFALSDTFIGVLPISTPLIWLTGNPVLAHNVLWIGSFFMAAVAAHALAHRLTGRHDVALVAGIAFGFNPYRAAQIPHLQMLLSGWMPLALLCLHRCLDTRRVRDLALFAICWFFNGATAGYYLFFFSALLGLWMIWFARPLRAWVQIGVAAVAGTLPLLPVIIGYQHYQSALHLTRNADEIQIFSADLTALASVSSFVWLPHWLSKTPGPEGELFPGLVVLLLAAAGTVAAWRAAPRASWPWMQRILCTVGFAIFTAVLITLIVGGWQIEFAGLHLSLNRPSRAMASAFWLLVAGFLASARLRQLWRERSTTFFYGAAAVAMYLFALGPEAHAFGVPVLFRAPYSLLTELPGGHSLRVPARFAMLFVLCLSQAAALFAARYLARRPASRLVPVALVLMLAESWVPIFPVAPVPPSLDLPSVEAGANVLELPLGDVLSETAALTRAMSHGRPLINGYSGYVPTPYYVLRNGIKNLDPSVLDYLQRLGPLAVIVTRDADPEGRYVDYVAKAEGAKPLMRSALGRVFLLPALPAPEPDTRRLDPLVPGRVSANGNPDIAKLMVDGNINTLWGTPKAQQPGDAITAEFDQPVSLRRVQLDLGDPVLEYPRVLRIAVAGPDGVDRTVWEGRTVARAFVGVLKDRLQTPIVIDLPEGVRGTRFTLTAMEADDDIPWAVSELHFFGER